MNIHIAVWAGTGLTAAALALAGPAAAAGGHAAPGHAGGIGPTPHVTQIHEWTNFLGQPASASLQGPQIGPPPSSQMIRTIAGLTPNPSAPTPYLTHNPIPAQFTTWS
jgi:hypothetical protein